MNNLQDDRLTSSDCNGKVHNPRPPSSKRLTRTYFWGPIVHVTSAHVSRYSRHSHNTNWSTPRGLAQRQHGPCAYSHLPLWAHNFRKGLLSREVNVVCGWDKAFLSMVPVKTSAPGRQPQASTDWPGMFSWCIAGLAMHTPVGTSLMFTRGQQPERAGQRTYQRYTATLCARRDFQHCPRKAGRTRHST